MTVLDYQDAVVGAAARFGGHIAKYLGDGVLVYFGWPQAYEHPADRAVRSGLDVVAAVSDLALDHDNKLKARVGIATGLVVIGELVARRGWTWTRLSEKRLTLPKASVRLI